MPYARYHRSLITIVYSHPAPRLSSPAFSIRISSVLSLPVDTYLSAFNGSLAASHASVKCLEFPDSPRKQRKDMHSHVGRIRTHAGETVNRPQAPPSPHNPILGLSSLGSFQSGTNRSSVNGGENLFESTRCSSCASACASVAGQSLGDIMIIPKMRENQ